MRAFMLFLAVVFVLFQAPAPALAASKGLGNFKEVNDYADGQFSDVEQGAWYESGVRSAYELGLMRGSSDTQFSVTGSLTIAEAVALAARLHAIYTMGTDHFIQGEPWYQTYADYALECGILSAPPEDYGKTAQRWEFVKLIDAALPEEAFAPTGTVLDGAIPDVTGAEDYGPAVYRLYRAGILTGSDPEGHFRPHTRIQRGEAAAIISRVCKEDKRKVNDLTNLIVLLYAADGRTRETKVGEVDAYLKVGWYRSIADALTADPWSMPRPYTDGSERKLFYVGAKHAGAPTAASALTRIEMGAGVEKLGAGLFSDSATPDSLVRVGIPATVTEVDPASFGDKFRRNVTVYCESGSAAEHAAKEAGVKTVAARPLYSAQRPITCMVTDEERPFYLTAGWCDSLEDVAAAQAARADKAAAGVIAAARVNTARGDYDGAMTYLRGVLTEGKPDQAIFDQIYAEQRAIADQWAKASGCPVGVGGNLVEPNTAGKSVVTLGLWNLSERDITAIQVEFDLVLPAEAGVDESNFHGGYQVKAMQPLTCGYGTWAMDRRDVQAIQKIRVVRVDFADGTSWIPA